jgi:hypothetical protein
MEPITVETFNTLNINQKAHLLSEKGKLIGHRKYLNREVFLHTFNSTYIEVYFNDKENRIEKIEAVIDKNVLLLYFSISKSDINNETNSYANIKR